MTHILMEIRVRQGIIVSKMQLVKAI